MALNYNIGKETGDVQTAPWGNATVTELQKRDPLDPAPLLQGFAQYEPMITSMEDEVKAVAVTDDATSANCAEMAGQSRKLFNEIEKKRKDVVEPYNGVVKMVNNTCKAITDRLQSCLRTLEDKNRNYMIEQDRKRREAEAKARAEAERLRKEAEAKARAEAEAKAKEMKVPVSEVPVEPVVVAPVYIPPAQTKVTTESGSQKIEYDMQWEIADFRQLPDECLQARAEEIKKAVAPWINAKKKAEIYNIPGVVFTKVPVLKTRAGR